MSTSARTSAITLLFSCVFLSPMIAEDGTPQAPTPIPSNDPANQRPIIGSATDWQLVQPNPLQQPTPVGPSSRMRLRLLRNKDLEPAGSNTNFGMYLECDNIQIQAGSSSGRVQYDFRCEGPVTIQHGNTSISGKGAEYSNGTLVILDAKIHLKSEAISMQSAKFQIDYKIAQLSMGTSSENPTPTVSHVSY